MLKHGAIVDLLAVKKSTVVTVTSLVTASVRISRNERQFPYFYLLFQCMKILNSK